MDKCTVCNRNPERMNSLFAQCSHVDCPHRKPDLFYPSDARMLEHAADEQEGELIPLMQKREKTVANGRVAKCRNCGSTDVRWRMQGGQWTLFSLQPGFEHRCGMDDFNED